MRKTHLTVLILVFCALSCAINPVTGKRELSLISEPDEIALGQQTDAEIRHQYGVYDDPELNGYVESVGKALVPYTHRPNLDYHFAVLDTPVVNAFAVPGGYIYVTRGIVALMKSEAELAVVLGHELGHVNARHSVRRISEMMLVQVGLAVGSALSETFAEISGLAGVGIQLLFLKYSRDDEREADALGVEYARKGTYNPGEMIGFFASLEKMGDLSGGHSLPGFLSTHPLTGERIEKVRMMLTESDRSLGVKRNDYLRRIDGIVYGNDPRQGYVDGQAFYHPELAFTFSFPSGWTVQNTPARVSIVSKDEKAAILLQAEKTDLNLSDYSRKKAADIKGSELVGEDRLSVSGLDSYHQIYDVPGDERIPLRLRLSVIRKGNYVYTLTALSSVQEFKTYDTDFRRTAQSFAPLKDISRLNMRASRLKVIKADGRSTLQQILSGAGIKKDLWPSFAIMNGMELDAKPSAGELVKIVN
jgi:predicted Zn-dependent protease